MRGGDLPAAAGQHDVLGVRARLVLSAGGVGAAAVPGGVLLDGDRPGRGDGVAVRLHRVLGGLPVHDGVDGADGVCRGDGAALGWAALAAYGTEPLVASIGWQRPTLVPVSAAASAAADAAAGRPRSARGRMPPKWRDGAPFLYRLPSTWGFVALRRPCFLHSIRLNDALNAKVHPDEVSPRSVVRGVTVAKSKDGMPLELYAPAEGYLGPLRWLQAHLHEMQGRQHAMPAFAGGRAGCPSRATHVLSGVMPKEHGLKGRWCHTSRCRTCWAAGESFTGSTTRRPSPPW